MFLQTINNKEDEYTQSLAPETANPTKAGVYISFNIILQYKKESIKVQILHPLMI